MTAERDIGGKTKGKAMADGDSKDDFSAWHLSVAGLHMRADATESGKLVLLADVLRWLMAEGGKGLPRAIAVDTLCTALEQASPEPDLFQALPDTYAEPLQGDAALFGFHTVDTWAIKELEREAREGRERFALSHNVAPENFESFPDEVRREIRDGYYAGRIRPGVTHVGERDKLLCVPGVAALVRRIREGASPDHPRYCLSSIAVRVSAVQALWGWGSVGQVITAAISPFPLADWVALVEYRKGHPGTSWADGNQIGIAMAKFREFGGNEPGKKFAALGTMAQCLGMGAKPLGRALFGERKRKSTASQGQTVHQIVGGRRKSG